MRRASWHAARRLVLLAVALLAVLGSAAPRASAFKINLESSGPSFEMTNTSKKELAAAVQQYAAAKACFDCPVSQYFRYVGQSLNKGTYACVQYGSSSAKVNASQRTHHKCCPVPTYARELATLPPQLWCKMVL